MATVFVHIRTYTGDVINWRCTCELWNSGEVQNGVNETKINGVMSLSNPF